MGGFRHLNSAFLILIAASAAGVTAPFAHAGPSDTACVLISGIEADQKKHQAYSFDSDRAAFFGGPNAPVLYKKIKWGSYDCWVVPSVNDVLSADGKPNPKYFPKGTKNAIVSNYTHGTSGGGISCDAGMVAPEVVSKTYTTIAEKFDHSFFFLNQCYGGDTLINHYLKDLKNSGRIDIAKKSCMMSLSSLGRIGTTQNKSTAKEDLLERITGNSKKSELALGILNAKDLPQSGESAVDFYLKTNHKLSAHPDALISSAMFSTVGMLNDLKPEQIDEANELLDRVFNRINAPAAQVPCKADPFPKTIACFNPKFTDQVIRDIAELSELTAIRKPELDDVLKAVQTARKDFTNTEPEYIRNQFELKETASIESIPKVYDLVERSFAELLNNSPNDGIYDFSKLGATLETPEFQSLSKELGLTPQKLWSYAVNRAYSNLFSSTKGKGPDHPSTSAANALQYLRNLKDPHELARRLGAEHRDDTSAGKRDSNTEFKDWIDAVARSQSTSERCPTFSGKQGAQYRYLLRQLLAQSLDVSAFQSMPSVIRRNSGASVVQENGTAGALGVSTLLPRFSRATAKISAQDRDAFDQATLKGCEQKFP